MPRQLHVFNRPDRFVAGTVGEPGARTFFLQAADGGRVISVALEKQQVALLADKLEQLLEQVVTRTGVTLPAAAGLDSDALSLPIDEEFRVSALGLAFNGDTGMVIIEAQAAAEDAETAERTLLEDVEDGPDALRVLIGPAEARSFIMRARLLVSAGRPPCPICNLPLAPTGHICPRQNGYHRGATLAR